MSALDVLFIHNNFPAQFRNLAQRMAHCPGVRVRAIAARQAPGLPAMPVQRYGFTSDELRAVHPFARRFEIECRRAEQVIYAANALKMDGFSPKLVYVHPGWGEALPLRALFPDAAICAYAEFYYWPSGTDVGFDKEFPRYGIDGETRVILRNAATLLSLADANFAIAPTIWQRSIFPQEFQSKIRVIHDGLDFGRLKPPAAPTTRPIGGQSFDEADEVVTFVARNLEPYRGFHVFMRAVPQILAARPRARICFAGGDRVSYGNLPVGHGNWREAMLAELGPKLDRRRVHFMGHLPYDDYLALLARSNAHIYLTYPFVLSWSLLEAMAMECLVIGSATPPVLEVVENGVNGLTVPFFEPAGIADTVVKALQQPKRGRKLRKEARRTVLSRYGFDDTSWPAHLALIDEFAFSGQLVSALKAAPID